MPAVTWSGSIRASSVVGKVIRMTSYTHIALGGGNDVFLAGVTAASMVANDFLF
jgi:hypothetical protein